MADFRKWLFALAAVALLAGLSVPASAQNALTCTVQTATDNLIRAEGMTEQVGDVVLACQGGTPTAAGVPVPSVNIQLFMNYNVTSKITGTQSTNGVIGTTVWNEALLIIDEPNSPTNPTVPLLYCDQTAASNNAGAGICTINGSGTGIGTYNGGTANGTTHPNVFQGRQPLNSLVNTSVVFNSVPFDPPGTNTTRILRFTNVRINASSIGAAASTVAIPITMGIGSSGNATVPISFSALVVATAQIGVTATVSKKNLGFAQCIGNDYPFSTTSGIGASTSPVLNPTSYDAGVTFVEGFSNAWKVRNVNVALTNGSFTNGPWVYNNVTPATTLQDTDLNQNVPGVNYFTEGGFSSFSSAANPTPSNPPAGLQTFGGGAVTTVSGGIGFTGPNASTTGITQAGLATQGTRLAVSLQGIPNGLTLYVPEVVFILRQATGVTTGVMVLVATDGVTGADTGAYTPGTAAAAKQTGKNYYAVATTNGAALLTYEVLYSDPYSNEYTTVPFWVSYTPNLSANAPIGLPQPGQIATVAGGFAPFYVPPTGTVASSSLPIPRFIFTGAYNPLIEVVKCSCNLLFPYVTQAPGYDTGIAIANTTADPFGTSGQYGTVTLNYYNGSTSAPIPQCTNTTSPGTCPGTTTVAPGQVLTYTLYNGSTQWGLNNSATGFTGYIIAQAQFQYCHAFAFIGGLGGGPAVNSQTNGLSEGYLALVLDDPSFFRTGVPGEVLSH